MNREPFADGEYYHLYNRGTNKMQIFNNHFDFIRFQKLLYLCNSKETFKFSDIETSPGRTWTVDKGETLVDIGIYALMDNHFHLVIKIKTGKEASLFLQRLLTSYSMYFNKKYDRTGSLFQGKTKSEHINNDQYFKYLFSYIHLNPIKILDPNWKNDGLKNMEGALLFLKNYKFSSFLDYSGPEREESKILNRDRFPEYFASSTEHFEELVEWLNYNKIDENIQ